jgi:hypothetical protein
MKSGGPSAGIMGAIYFLLSLHGGISPAARRRSPRTLTMVEREAISRGIASGSSGGTSLPFYRADQGARKRYRSGRGGAAPARSQTSRIAAAPVDLGSRPGDAILAAAKRNAGSLIEQTFDVIRVVRAGDQFEERIDCRDKLLKV